MDRTNLAAGAGEVRADVERLALAIGERHVGRPRSLTAAAAWLAAQLDAAGHEVGRQVHDVGGVACENLDVELAGTADRGEVVVVGAHHDTVPGSPGANDNGSGCAALLALGRMLAGRRYARTVRLALFVNEEPPWFTTADMGSLLYARRCRERGERVTTMMSLETIGYFTHGPGSHEWPPFVGLGRPDVADFSLFATSLRWRGHARALAESFERHSDVPVEWGAAPELVAGVGWSDHWSFWRQGFPAVRVTDTALFRDPAYHGPGDTPERLDFVTLARAVAGLHGTIEDAAGRE